jgi:hypothetical protein
VTATALAAAHAEDAIQQARNTRIRAVDNPKREQRPVPRQ